MPELPEVEAATNLVRITALGKKIESVETAEDTIVFSGINHEAFASEITGRRVVNVGRYGKVFYLELDGEGRMPVLHFGMTGMLQIQGIPPRYYKEGPKKLSTVWPPKFMKFILHIYDEETKSTTQLAFIDARRLARIRLCLSPMTETPISALGFDPILSMPALKNFESLVLKRKCPIKALLLDQSFSAGVGNWVADEILYHARVHPEQRCHTLSKEQLAALHEQTGSVCRIAVAANADDSQFPSDWLFKHRWGKGKKHKHTLTLPSGDPATIEWITVGGRTSAYVTELQILGGNEKEEVASENDPNESDLTPLSDEGVVIATVRGKRKAPDDDHSPRRSLTPRRNTKRTK